LSLGFCNHSPPCPRGGLHRHCAPGSPASAPLRSPPSTFLSVGGGCSRISSFGTPQGAHHRRLQLQWWPLPDLPPAPPRGPAINVFSFGGDPYRTCRQHPPGGPPSTSSTSVWLLPFLPLAPSEGPPLTYSTSWFYDTFTGAATGAACCGSFVGEGFGLLVTSYG
jgi:hypothetical protein